MWVVQQDHYHDLLVPRVFLNITGCDARHDTFLVPEPSTAFRLQFQPLRQEANSKVFDRNAEVESSIAISVHLFLLSCKKKKKKPLLPVVSFRMNASSVCCPLTFFSCIWQFFTFLYLENSVYIVTSLFTHRAIVCHQNFDMFSVSCTALSSLYTI